MERIKWLIIPYILCLTNIFLTQLTVPVFDNFIELNPINNYFYQQFGSFIFAPFLAAFIIFVALPLIVEFGIRISKKKYRKLYEWVVISLAIVMYFINFINDFLNFALVYNIL